MEVVDLVRFFVVAYIYQIQIEGCVYDCSSVPDGSYNWCGNSCDVYISCYGGTDSYLACSLPQSFDETFKSCVMTSSTCPGTTRNEFRSSLSSSSSSSSPTHGKSSEGGTSPTTIHPTDVSTSVKTLSPIAASSASSTSKSPATTSATTLTAATTTTGRVSEATTTKFSDVSNVSTAAAAPATNIPKMSPQLFYKSLPALPVTITFTTPHDLRCVRIFQGQPACHAFAFRRSRPPVNGLCLHYYYDRSTFLSSLRQDANWATYII